MSFIYNDPKLIEKLVKSGLDFENKFVKKGQAAPDPAAAPPDTAALQEHIKQLQAQLRPPAKDPNAPATVGSQGTNDVSLDVTHLKNLGTLIAFLATNQITVDGKRVAYAPNENVQDPSYQLYKLEGVADTRTSQAQNVQYNYRVNKDLLVAYLTTVQAHLAQNPNPVLNVQLRNIIQAANDQLDTNISSTYKEPAKTLAPDKVVDNLPQNLKTQYPYQEGSLPLTFGDITSATAFNAWIQKNNIFVDDKNYKFPQYNFAGLLTALADRAKNQLVRAASDDAKLTATVYAAQVPKLAQMFNVTLGAGSAQSATQQGGQGGQGAAATNQPPPGLEQLVSALPLDRDQLDFGKVRAFINLYRSTVLSSTDPSRKQQASAAMDQAEQYMQGATQNTVDSRTNFSMDGLTASDLISWATPPSAGQATRSRGSARALADYLEYTVREVGTLIKDLYNAHYQELSEKPQLLQAIEQQAGGSSIPFGSSTVASNINNISVARSNLPQAGAQ